MRQFDTIPQRAAGVFWKPASAHRLNKASATWGRGPASKHLTDAPTRRETLRRRSESRHAGAKPLPWSAPATERG
jgi:hypothetical protein